MNTIVENLQSKIDEVCVPLVQKIDVKKNVYLLDAPDHANVGDQAILLGELAFIRRHIPKANISIASFRTYNTMLDSSISDAEIIFLHGGGSFGDIWPVMQNFRLEILKRHPQKTIVQFPQSIHFDDYAFLQETREIIGKCNNFHFLARDKKSFDFAKKNFDCAISLCPDMAFYLGPLKSNTPTLEYLGLLRTDKEVLELKHKAISDIFTSIGSRYEIHDWLVNSPRLTDIHRYIRKLSGIKIFTNLIATYGISAFELYAWQRMAVGIDLLSRGQIVFTDRLHGHIITTLLGRPHFVFDSYDGKISAFHKTWLQNDSTSLLVNGIEDFKSFIEKRIFCS